LKSAETTPGGHHRFNPEIVAALAGAPSPKLGGKVKLISTSAAARLLGVSQHTVMRACREGRLDPDETTPGGHHRFSETRIRELAPAASDLVGIGRAARALGLSVDKLRRAVQLGLVTPAAVTPGGHLRFAAADLPSSALLPDENGGRQTNGNGAAHGTP
jgi:DNA-binding transcriptional MerR regulator